MEDVDVEEPGQEFHPMTPPPPFRYSSPSCVLNSEESTHPSSCSNERGGTGKDKLESIENDYTAFQHEIKSALSKTNTEEIEVF